MADPAPGTRISAPPPRPDPRRREIAVGLFREHLDLAAIRRALPPPEAEPAAAADAPPVFADAAPRIEAAPRARPAFATADPTPARAATPRADPASSSARPPPDAAPRDCSPVALGLALGLVALGMVGTLDGPPVAIPPDPAPPTRPVVADPPTTPAAAPAARAEIEPAARMEIAPAVRTEIALPPVPPVAAGLLLPAAVLTAPEIRVAAPPDAPLPAPDHPATLLAAPAPSRPAAPIAPLAGPAAPPRVSPPRASPISRAPLVEPTRLAASPVLPASPRARPASLENLPVERSAPPPATAPTAVRGQPRVVIHYSAAQGRPAGDGLTAALARAGIPGVEWRAVRFPISRSNIRFFHPGDGDAGRAVAAAISRAGVAAPARDFTHFTPRPSSGTIEVWLGG